MRLLLVSMLLVASAIAPLGCHHAILSPSPPAPTVVNLVPSPIQSFIRSQPLPKPQPEHVFVSLNHGTIEFFSLSYGELHYDLAGDWYSVAWGLRYGRRIGWIAFSEGPGSMDVTLFDPSADEIYLFAEETWNALQSDSLREVDRWLFEGGFIPMLAGDPETPEATLIKIENAYLSYAVAWRLLENPTAQRSRTILTVLADHPVQDPWDPWLQIRERARTLLAALA